MAIEFSCSGCGRLLRVGDEYAGRRARCPHCNSTVDVTADEPMAELVEPDESSDTAGEQQESAFSFDTGRSNPYSSPPFSSTTEGPTSRRLQPNRGAAILTLGILGIVICGFLGPVAWVMGNADLEEIRRGTMDRSGEGMVQAGWILGIIGTVLLGISVVWVLILMAAN